MNVLLVIRGRETAVATRTGPAGTQPGDEARHTSDHAGNSPAGGGRDSATWIKAYRGGARLPPTDVCALAHQEGWSGAVQVLSLRL